jgi:hypothetical protein
VRAWARSVTAPIGLRAGSIITGLLGWLRGLPRPRDQVDTKELSEFAHLRAHVYRLIKGERAAAQNTGGLPTSPRV